MIEINNKTKNKINLPLVKKIAQKFLQKYKKADCDVSLAFVGDAEMKKLNKQYRHIDKPTDILSFAGEEKDFLGEIVIDYAQIKRQAKLYSGSVEEELVFILVHGLLHLLDYDDETEEGKINMDKLGKKFINSL